MQRKILMAVAFTTSTLFGVQAENATMTTGVPQQSAAATATQVAPAARSYDDGTGRGASYVAGIWVDPDGCQHWVMDLGVEGMMDPVLDSNGKPRCSNACAIAGADAMFPTGSSVIRPEIRPALVSAATQIKTKGRSFALVGHTDNVGSNASNQTLSTQRAQAVANVLAQNGISVTGVSGAGETSPRASNASAEGRQQNRRVEFICN